MREEQPSGQLTLDKEASPHIGHPHHQTELVLVPADHRQLAELDGLRSLLGSAQLSQKGSRNEDLSQTSEDQLSHQREDGQGTFLRDVAVAIADGGLRLQGEEEGACHARHVFHAKCVVGIPFVIHVSVPHADVVVHDAKDEPGHQECGGEQGQLVAPSHVHDGGPDVVEVQLDHALHVIDSHVAVPVLGYHPSAISVIHAGHFVKLGIGHCLVLDLHLPQK